MFVILPLTIEMDMNFELNNLNVKGRKTTLATAITDFVSHAPVICEEADQVVFDSGSILHLMLYEKKIMCQDTRLKYIS